MNVSASCVANVLGFPKVIFAMCFGLLLWFVKLWFHRLTSYHVFFTDMEKRSNRPAFFLNVLLVVLILARISVFFENIQCKLIWNSNCYTINSSKTNVSYGQKLQSVHIWIQWGLKNSQITFHFNFGFWIVELS